MDKKVSDNILFLYFIVTCIIIFKLFIWMNLYIVYIYITELTLKLKKYFEENLFLSHIYFK